jgi:hypothetical protein
MPAAATAGAIAADILPRSFNSFRVFDERLANWLAFRLPPIIDQDDAGPIRDTVPELTDGRARCQ